MNAMQMINAKEQALLVSTFLLIYREKLAQMGRETTVRSRVSMWYGAIIYYKGDGSNTIIGNQHVNLHKSPFLSKV